MIYIRDDDVLMGSKASFQKFKEVHELLCKLPALLLHVPGIIVNELRFMPEVNQYIREETKAGRMLPQVHGFVHRNYDDFELNEIVDHLNRCKKFIEDTYEYSPRYWFTPWGAMSQKLTDAGAATGLETIDCSERHKLRGEDSVWDFMQRKSDMKYLDGETILIHYWDNLDRRRLKDFVNYIQNTGTK